MQNSKIVGMVKKVGCGDCYTYILWWKMKIGSDIIKWLIMILR